MTMRNRLRLVLLATFGVLCASQNFPLEVCDLEKDSEHCQVEVTADNPFFNNSKPEIYLPQFKYLHAIWNVTEENPNIQIEVKANVGAYVSLFTDEQYAVFTSSCTWSAKERDFVGPGCEQYLNNSASFLKSPHYAFAHYNVEREGPWAIYHSVIYHAGTPRPEVPNIWYNFSVTLYFVQYNAGFFPKDTFGLFSVTLKFAVISSCAVVGLLLLVYYIYDCNRTWVPVVEDDSSNFTSDVLPSAPTSKVKIQNDLNASFLTSDRIPTTEVNPKQENDDPADDELHSPGALSENEGTQRFSTTKEPETFTI